MTNNIEEELKKFEEDLSKIVFKYGYNYQTAGKEISKKRKEAIIKSKKYGDERLIEMCDGYLELLY